MATEPVEGMPAGLDGGASPTTPPIFDSQNEEPRLRMLAAQRRLYSDAKVASVSRLVVLAVGSIGATLTALAFPDARGVVGAVFTFVLAAVQLVGSAREKRCNRNAAAVQEQFDVEVFGLPWNDLLIDRPTPTLIADAARRYNGPDTLRDWYPDTDGVHRPLDVLICQRTNVGWGASLHRAWAVTLAAGVATVAGVAILIGMVGGLKVTDFLLAVLLPLLPLLPLLREGYEAFVAHRDSADEKTSVEQKIMALWREGLAGSDGVTVADCRKVQDRIVMLRLANAVIPDWF